MENEKKALLKGFKKVIDDLLDNYDKYTDAEKNQIKDLFQRVSELNAILDKYDIEAKFDWQEYFISVSRYFDTIHY